MDTGVGSNWRLKVRRAMRTKKKVLLRLDVEAGRKRLLSAVLWMTVFCCLLAVRVEASPTDLADQGIPLMPVVVAPTANASVRLSATNLALKLSQIVGGTFTVATGDGSTGIAVGLGADFTEPTWPFGGAYFDAVDPTRYEEYGLQSHANGVFVGGASSMAVEHAVWDLLFRMGWRQFFPSASWEVTPSNPDLAIEVQASRECPDYYDRNFWYGWGTWPDNAALTTQWKLRNRVGRGLVINLGHAYQSISLEPSDGGGWCECANCASLGSISDRVVTLNNQVADALDPAYPNTYLGMYAYNQHSGAPRPGRKAVAVQEQRRTSSADDGAALPGNPSEPDDAAEGGHGEGFPRQQRSRSRRDAPLVAGSVQLDQQRRDV